MNNNERINHEYVMSMIEKSQNLVEIPNGLTQSKIQTCLSKYSKYDTYNKIPSKDFAKVSVCLILGASFDSEIIKLELDKICKQNFDENSDLALEYLINKFMTNEELTNIVEEVKAATYKKQALINNEINKDAHLYIVPNRPKKSGGNFHTCYVSKNVDLDLEQIITSNFGMDEVMLNGTIYSDQVDALEDIIRLKYDNSFRRIGGIILHKFETIGSVNVFGPKKDDVVETQIADLENTINNMTLMRDGLSSELLKMQSSLEKIKKYKK